MQSLRREVQVRTPDIAQVRTPGTVQVTTSDIYPVNIFPTHGGFHYGY